ncbi:MAG: shikimate dehydrogenase [Candidatus Nitrosopelagicus sp.]|jgi:shikimate dehydrogenase|nr:shikimate dehydrogenase [Candidatus Nitrosopelagicus sp.]
MLRTFAVIGDPIDHSLSPTIHNAAYRHLDLECTYIAYKIDENELESGIQSLKSIKISGFNVTIPHKIRIMDLLDDMDHDCKLIGAANTIVNDDGFLKGYNTDMGGFIEPIKNREISIKNSSVLLLGAGGASRAVIAGFAKEHARKITIVNRTIEKANNLARFGKDLELESDVISIDDMKELNESYDFVVNASSLGLKNESNIIPTKLIDEKTTVYDIVYKPVNTELIKDAKKKNAQIIYGYEMLLAQAARSFEIWLKQKAPYEAMKKAILGGF